MDNADKTRAQLLAELAELRDDVSERSQSRARVFESVRAIIIEMDAGGRFTYVSPTVTEVLGYLPDEVYSTQDRNFLHTDDREPLAELLRKITSSGQAEVTHIRVRHKAGHWLWLSISIDGYRDGSGETHTVALARDVTAEFEASESLRVSEARYRALAENVMDLILEIDEDGEYTYIGPNCEAILGYTAEQLRSGDLRGPPNLTPETNGLLSSYFEEGSSQTAAVVYRFRHGNGSWHWLESSGSARRGPDGQRRTVIISRDVTERTKAEQDLAMSEARYRRLADVSEEWITESDHEGRLLYASQNCEKVFGRSVKSFIGTTPLWVIHPDDVEERAAKDIEATLNGEPFTTKPYRVFHADGSWLWVESRGCTYRGPDGNPVILRVTREITDRVQAEEEKRELEARMQQAQKLEGLGVMAGGIAHDFNNLLTPILGDTSLALLDLPPESPVRPRLQKVQAAAHRAAALTNQMLAYAGEETLHIESVNLSNLVEEMGTLLETAASREAIVEYEIASDLPFVEADAARLSQVVMNLITNASEALGHDEGRITLSTGTVDLTSNQLQLLVMGSDRPAGEYCFAEVRDTGCGMDAETLSKIFDPFFTTKLTGRGLGLAAVLGIVQSHRGAIDLRSTPGKGTTFRVLFPSTKRRFEAHAAPILDAGDWQTEGLVLVVDAEEGVPDLCADTLARAGLDVICATHGREGIELFERHQDEIRAVLLDRTMPTTSGEEAFIEMRRIQPNARIILVSGYSKDEAGQRFMDKGLDAFLKKPFLPSSLLRMMREVLER